MIPPSVERIEQSGFSVWSPDETTTIGGWKVASSGGYTRRLNSATTIGSADTSRETRDAIATWLADRGSPLTVRVTPLIDTATTRACVRVWGLESVDETLVLVGRPVASNGDGDVRVVDPLDPDYTTELFALNHRGSDVAGPWSRIAERIGPHAAGLWIPGNAVGFVAVHDGIASVFSVAVRPEARRTGLATRIMESAATWAVQMGADSMFVQVVGTNAPALRLYESLGFAETYRYHYLQASPGGHTYS